MNKIITVGEITKLVSSLKEQGKKIVLAGGCFDILHHGHIIFLKKAKAAGDILIIFLESDKKIKMLKGEKRPVNSQKDRAKALSAIPYVDYVIPLPFYNNNSDYDKLAGVIDPDIIATTKGDKSIAHKKRAALLTGARVKFVTPIVGSYSSSKILEREDFSLTLPYFVPKTSFLRRQESN